MNRGRVLTDLTACLLSLVLFALLIFVLVQYVPPRR